MSRHDAALRSLDDLTVKSFHAGEIRESTKAQRSLISYIEDCRVLERALFIGGRLAVDCDEIECDEQSCPDAARAFPDAVGCRCHVIGWVERRLSDAREEA